MGADKRRLSGDQVERRRYWRGMIAEWRQSGLSQSAFCRRHKLRVQQFSKWKICLADNHQAECGSELTVQAKSDFTGQAASKAQAQPNAFIEIPSAAGACASGGVYEIITPCDYRIRIEGGCQPEVLSGILSAVRQQSC